MIIRINERTVTSQDYESYEEFSMLIDTLFTPFKKFKKILHHISGFQFPSGVAFISEKQLIENIYIGQTEEASLHTFKEETSNRFLLHNNYAGPEGGIYSWKGLTQSDIENAFNIKFDNKIIQNIGGFPSNCTICFPA